VNLNSIWDSSKTRQVSHVHNVVKIRYLQLYCCMPAGNRDKEGLYV